MFRRIAFPLLLTLSGCAVLLALGIWQVQRLEWKEGVLAEIDARVNTAPQPLPREPQVLRDKYLPVTVTGRPVREPLYVLTTVEGYGPGYRYITPFLAEERVFLVDLGWVPLATFQAPPYEGELTVTGNLHWPEEVDGWTPDPAGRLWYARDVMPMAVELGTEAMLVVAREVTANPSAVDGDDGPQNVPFAPLPVTSAGVPNNHLNYAITWFLMALVWAGMGAYLVARVLRQKEG